MEVNSAALRGGRGSTPITRHSSRLFHGSKRCLEIGYQVIRILEADVHPYRRTARLPGRGGADPLGIGDLDEAFEAAPARAYAEELECVDERCGGLLAHRDQHERKERGGAVEVALPDLVARIVLERRVEHALHVRALLEPARDLERVRHL